MRITNLTEPKSMIYSSNVYLVLGDGNAPGALNSLIDVGNDPAIIGKIQCALTDFGKKAIDQVILTHGHSDHVGVLPLIREAFNPIVLAVSPSVSPDGILEDGQRVRCGDRIFEVIYTPGHTDDSLCLYGQKDGTLFVGDTPVVIRSSEGCYEDRLVWALERLCRKDVRIIYFGHGAPVTKHAQAVLAESLQNVRSAQSIRGRPDVELTVLR